ncbi:MAG TPA: MoaD/ThiS family protein [Dehalococcoidia bacterium]|nr:MoaD/ThiS family protein [Dehalococcoidia bacterium]
MDLTTRKTKEGQAIKVTVEVMSWLKEDFGHQGWDKLVIEETVSPGTSVMDLLRVIADKHPRFGQKAFAKNQDFLDYCAVIRNGTFLSALADLNTELQDGDNIKLSPGFYGG